MAANAIVRGSEPDIASQTTGSGVGGSAGRAPRHAALPGGTVTFAFTDIEASTQLLRRLGDSYVDLLAEHRRIVRGAFRSANGTEIDRQGDAFFFAFPRARDAVAGAVEAQRGHATAAWPADVAVRVRIGLHTGEPTVGDEGYLGIDVVLAARICKAADGGEVLLSESTRALARSTLPDGVSAVRVGERHFKDIDTPVCVYRLAIAAADSGHGPSAGLPIPPDREREIGRRFRTVGIRLVTEVGTRVADSLETVPGAGRTPHAWATLENDNVDDLAARAVASLEGKLRAGVVAFAAVRRKLHVKGDAFPLPD
jgi:class 3 adenylate cyclase